jgi:hypothetical protein
MNLRHVSIRRPAARRAGHLVLAALAAALGTALPSPGTAGDAPPYSAKEDHATLTYSIDIAGHAHKGNAKSGTYSDALVHQHLDGTFHLKGEQGYGSTVDNAQQLIDQSAPARQAMEPAIEKAMASCGEDEACMMAAMKRMATDMRRDHPGMLDKVRGMKAKLTRHDFGRWALDPMKPRCSLHAVTQGSSRYRTLDVGEGYSDYVNGSMERHGEGRDDCAAKGVLGLPNASAEWDGDKRILTLDLPGLTVDEQARDANGKTSTRQVTIRDIELGDLHWSGKGPQSGQQTRQVEVDGVPATMTVRWTFTPGQA